MSDGLAARRFLRRHHDGALSTISIKVPGYPFGSVSPFVLDHTAAPVILISKLAEHTRNIDADGRVSLLVRDGEADAQAGARLTVVGEAKMITAMNADLPARYLNYFPDAARLLALGDFSFYRIEPLILRFIGGFGAIHWIPAASFSLTDDTMSQCEPQVLAHMNADHGASLRAYCRHYHRCEPRQVSMIGIDADGFDVRADDALLRFDFATTVHNAQEARAALISMSREARAR